MAPRVLQASYALRVFGCVCFLKITNVTLLALLVRRVLGLIGSKRARELVFEEVVRFG